jgi:hypothetical protein
MERVSVTESPYGERERLNDALIRFNLLRTRQPQDPLVTDLLEGAVDALFSASHHLIAYGSSDARWAQSRSPCRPPG